MERATLLEGEISIATKEPLLRSCSSLFAMSINFNIERAMRDKVGKYYFSRSDPDDSCRCGTGVGSGLHFSREN